MSVQTELKVVVLRHLEGKHADRCLTVRRGVEEVGGGIHVPTEFDIGGDQLGDRRRTVWVIHRARSVVDVGNRLDGLAITRLDAYEWHSTSVHRCTGVTPAVFRCAAPRLASTARVGYSDHVVKPGVLRCYALLLLRCRSEAS